MDLLIDIAALVGGGALLWIAADHFVIGAVRLAFVWRVSTVVIGAVIIGFGTSAPELFVSGIAAAQGTIDIAVGNIVGSNIANLTLVLGAVALLRPLDVQTGIVRREGPLSTASVALFMVVVLGGTLARWEGVLLLVALVVVLWIIIRASARAPEAGVFAQEVSEFVDDSVGYSVSREAVRVGFGLAGTLGGAYILVVGARGLADAAGLSEGLVGVTIVAVGTSLPELVTGVQAARKGETDLVLGNLFGSNIFNSLAVGGVAAVVGPGQIDDIDLAGTASFIMLGVAVLVLVMMATRRRIDRLEGAILLTLYAGTVAWLA